MGMPGFEGEGLICFDAFQDGLLAEICVVRAGRGVVLVDAAGVSWVGVKVRLALQKPRSIRRRCLPHAPNGPPERGVTRRKIEAHGRERRAISLRPLFLEDRTQTRQALSL